MYLLDTNIISYFFRGNETVANKIDEFQDAISTTSIVIAELFFGTKSIPDSTKKLEIEDFYNDFIGELSVYDFNVKSALIFSELKFVKNKTGQTIADFDLMIASICLANDLILVTHNTKHFQNIPSLKLEDWTI